MTNQDVILLKVFSGGSFSGSLNKYGTSTGQDEICRSIPDFDRDYMSYFELRDCLKGFGLKDGDSLYYLKPGYSPPNGLVLIFDDNQCNQLLSDHVGLSSCSLYIVPAPERLVTTELYAKTNQTETIERGLVDTFRSEEINGGEHDDSIGEDMAQLSADDDDNIEAETYQNTYLEEIDTSSDVELVPEHEVENKAVDAGGYIFDGDVGDDELYNMKEQQFAIQSKGKYDGTNQDQGKGKLSGREISRAKKVVGSSSTNMNHEGLYLSDDPDDGNHTPNDVDEETPVFVHRSRGLEDNWFDEVTMSQPIMKEGMLFADVGQFREAMKNLIIREGRKVQRKKNDQEKVSAKCLGVGCEWYIYARVIPGEKTFKLRKFMNNHTCGRSHDVQQIDAKWIAKEYVEEFRIDRDWKVKSLKASVLRDTQIGISKYKAYRAKREAVRMVLGDHVDQFKRIQDYAHTLLHVNPGSMVVIKCDVSEDPTVNPVFERMFISFKAQIDGFKAGCRPFIGVDGTHVKLPNGAQILAATGRDANNNMYPLAFALVESENNNSWEWFLHCLRDCIGDGQEHGGWVFMSDRQKGILNVVPNVFPGAEHRFCLRHLHANFVSAGYGGDELKKLMEKASYAYRQYDFDVAMEKIKNKNFEAWVWLKRIPPEHWCRHKFSSRAKTDLVVNNISETYNSSILEARDEPVITMLEHMRSKIMEGYATKEEGAQRDKWQIAPNYQKRLEFEKHLASFCRPICAGRGIWQVSMTEFTFVVDLNSRTCGCRKWDVTGIPCCHAVSAIQAFNHRPEEYVDDLFKKEAYLLSYAGQIMPVPDKTQWLQTPFPDVDPRRFTVQPGRPKKKRRKAPGERHVPPRSSKRVAIRCSRCTSFGHDVSGCKMRKSVENRGGTKSKGSQEKRGRKPKNDATSSSQHQSQPSTLVTGPQQQRRKPRNHTASSSQQQPQMISTSQPEVQLHSQPPLDPIPMNNWYGIGMFHQVDGGPTIDRIRASRERLLKKK